VSKNAGKKKRRPCPGKKTSSYNGKATTSTAKLVVRGKKKSTKVGAGKEKRGLRERKAHQHAKGRETNDSTKQEKN